MRAPDPNAQKGELILYTGPMNSGKTETLVKHAKNLEKHAGQKIMAFSIIENTRDGENQIIGENGERIPATGVSLENPEDILQHVEEEDKKGYVNIILLDEVSFHEHKIIKVINYFRAENRLIMAAGLDKSFRGEPLKYIQNLKEMVNPQSLAETTFNSYCKVIKNGKQCRNTATHTLRLYKQSKQKVQFLDKEGQLITGFGYAPYFDKLVLFEKKEISERQYTAACPDCFKIPYKDETIDAYNELIKGRSSSEIKVTHLDEIVNMLVEENKIYEVEKNIYAPREYIQDIETGVYIPKK